jgi:multisubunit Na+/H+ antiporter MnhB subunit
MEPTFYGLMVFLIVGSIVALEMKDILSSVIAVGVVGMAVSILFLLLGAPDIAITQVVVEIIVVTVLIRAAAKTGKTALARRPDLVSTVLGLVLILVFCGFALSAFRTMRPFGDPRPLVANWYILHAEAQAGCANAVMSVVLDFRGYDTLGEATVILTSILGAVVLLRPKAREDGADAPAVAAAPPAVKAEVAHE